MKDNTTINILFIEDSFFEIELIQEMLSTSKMFVFSLQSANSIRDGLHLLHTQRFELILLDLNLPDSDPEISFQVIKKYSHGIPIIVLTGYDDKEFALKTIQAGAQDYLIKGQINVTMLLNSVRYAIERHRLQYEITQSKRHLEKILNSLELCVFMIDSESKQIIECNDAATKIFGYGREELIGNTEAFLFGTPVEYSSFSPPYNTTMYSDAFSLQELLMRRKDASLFPVSRSITPFQDDTGTVRSWLCVISDISEQKTLERQLIQAQKMEAIGALAGGIAHDFNNILFPIMGYTQILMAETQRESDSYRNLQEILIGAERARDLIKQILTFSRQSDAQKKPLKIQLIIKEALKLIRSSIPSTIIIRQSINNQCSAVLADPTQIHQVLMNLCTNAYHAMEATGGTLEVRLNEITLEGDSLKVHLGDLPPGRYVQLSVSDTGHGIPQPLIHRIFDPYFTTKEEGRGSGLGLSVVHGIVKQHGGAIRLYSELHKGTVFHVYFPLIERESKEINAVTEEIIYTGTEHILLVDDDLHVLQMVKKMLEKLGYQITERSSSLEAYEAFVHDLDKYDLIITDMTMPNMTGEQLAKKILELKPDMSIIICTGFSERFNEEKIKKLGIKASVMKPIIRSELSKVIRNVIDAKTTQEQ
ncbi:MAG: response regulator [Desulfobacterales bacterium]|nr:response regulator [Desulfobacterales bacterium]